MVVILLALASALGLGLYDIAKKRALERSDALPTLVGASLFGALLALPVLAFDALRGGAIRSTLDLRLSELFLISLKSLLVSASWILNYQAQKKLPLSLAASLRSTSPLLTVGFSILFLGERLNLPEALGVLLILASYFALGRAAKFDRIDLLRTPAVGLLALGTLLASTSGLYDKILLGPKRLPPLAVQIVFTFENALILGAFLALVERGAARRRRPVLDRSTFAIAVALLLADVAYFHALAIPEARVSLVSALRRTSILVAFAASALVFREKHLRSKSVPVGLALVGVTLLVAAH